MNHFYKKFKKSDLYSKIPMSQSTFNNIIPKEIVCPKGRNDLCPHCVSLSKVRSNLKISDEKWGQFMKVIEETYNHDNSLPMDLQKKLFEIEQKERIIQIKSDQLGIYDEKNEVNYDDESINDLIELFSKCSIETDSQPLQQPPQQSQQPPQQQPSQQPLQQQPSQQQPPQQYQQQPPQQQPPQQSQQQPFNWHDIFVLDVETNGFGTPVWITQISIYYPVRNEFFDRVVVPIRHGKQIILLKTIMEMTHLPLTKLEHGQEIEEVLKDMVLWVEARSRQAKIICHNAKFEVKSLRNEFTYCKFNIPDWTFYCSCEMCNKYIFYY
jgi:hypothetical protein